jgi:hypothetical protein
VSSTLWPIMGELMCFFWALYAPWHARCVTHNDRRVVEWSVHVGGQGGQAWLVPRVLRRGGDQLRGSQARAAASGLLAACRQYRPTTLLCNVRRRVIPTNVAHLWVVSCRASGAASPSASAYSAPAMPAMGGYGAGSTRTTIPIAQPQQQPAFTLPVSPRIEPPPHKEIKKVRASQTHTPPQSRRLTETRW